MSSPANDAERDAHIGDFLERRLGLQGPGTLKIELTGNVSGGGVSSSPVGRCWHSITEPHQGRPQEAAFDRAQEAFLFAGGQGDELGAAARRIFTGPRPRCS
ncbi:hypothetical protein [Actinomadura pelletieri]|uniref:hypothetical protein n=1 Tax=Actinomadura pelletieri TaxID=111805 RepID=UPI000EAC1CB6|nr:hypothetical protein [Actinomadura pelletieri]